MVEQDGGGRGASFLFFPAFLHGNDWDRFLVLGEVVGTEAGKAAKPGESESLRREEGAEGTPAGPCTRRQEEAGKDGLAEHGAFRIVRI